MPNVLCPRDLVSRPNNMNEIVPHTHTHTDCILGMRQSLEMLFSTFFIGTCRNICSSEMSSTTIKSTLLYMYPGKTQISFGRSEQSLLCAYWKY